MQIRKYYCPNCNREHFEKIYENKSEAVSDIFVDSSFWAVWNAMKDKVKSLSFEEFCKELVFTSVYNFHKNLKRFKVRKNSIRPMEKDEQNDNV